MFFPDDDNRHPTTRSDSPSAPSQNRAMGRRNVLAGIGALGIAGGFGMTRVLAQDATPTVPADEADDEETEPGEIEQTHEKGEMYEDFVAKLSANLGETDTATVDTAIRDALKAMVDAQFDAGNISRNAATALKDRIDTSDAPIAVAMLGGMGHRIRVHRSGRPDDDISTEEESEPANDGDLHTTEATTTG